MSRGATQAKTKQASRLKVPKLDGDGSKSRAESKRSCPPADANQAYALALKSLQAATLALVRQGSIKNRLCTAFLKHLEALDTERLPEIIRNSFCELTKELTRQPPVVAGDDAVRATIRKMSHKDADSCAEQIVLMYDSLVRYGQSV